MKKLIFFIFLIFNFATSFSQLSITVDSLRQKSDTLWISNRKGSVSYIRTSGDSLYLGDISGEMYLGLVNSGGTSVDTLNVKLARFNTSINQPDFLNGQLYFDNLSGTLVLQTNTGNQYFVDSNYVSGQNMWIQRLDTIYKVDTSNYSFISDTSSYSDTSYFSFYSDTSYFSFYSDTSQFSLKSDSSNYSYLSDTSNYSFKSDTSNFTIRRVIQTDTTIYIGAITGNDITGDGSILNPYATILRALEDVENTIISNCTFTLSFIESGTYTFGDAEKAIYEGGIEYASAIRYIVGIDTVIESSVSFSEAISNQMLYNASKGGVTLTENQWRGYYLSDPPRLYPISYNSAGTSTFQVEYLRGARNGSRNIVDVSVILDATSASGNDIFELNAPGVSSTTFERVKLKRTGNTFSFITLQNFIDFSFGTTFECSDIILGQFSTHTQNALNFTGCLFNLTSSSVGISTRNAAGNYNFTRSAIFNTNNSSTRVLDISKGSTCELREAAIVGGNGDGISSWRLGSILLSKTNIFRGVTSIMDFPYTGGRVLSNEDQGYNYIMSYGANYIINSVEDETIIDLKGLVADGSLIDTINTSNIDYYVNLNEGYRIFIDGTYKSIKSFQTDTITSYKSISNIMYADSIKIDKKLIKGIKGNGDTLITLDFFKDSIITQFIFENGLTLDGNNVKLGGTVIEPTNIDLGINSLNIDIGSNSWIYMEDGYLETIFQKSGKSWKQFIFDGQYDAPIQLFNRSKIGNDYVRLYVDTTTFRIAIFNGSNEEDIIEATFDTVFIKNNSTLKASQIITENITSNNIYGTSLIFKDTSLSYSEGMVYYDSIEKALILYNNLSDYKQILGYGIPVPYHNDAGETIAKGKLLRSSGAKVNGSIKFLAKYAGNGSLDSLIGVAVSLTTTLSNQDGLALLIGTVTGLNTSSFNDGDILYVGNNGEYTNISPEPPLFNQIIGRVQYADNDSGSIYLFPGGETKYRPEPIFSANFQNQSVTITNIGQNIYSHITNGTNTLFNEDINFGFELVGDSIRPLQSGLYIFDFAYSFSGDAANNDTWNVGIFKNGVLQYKQARTSSSTNLGGVTFGKTVSLTNSDWITFKISNTTIGTRNSIFRDGVINAEFITRE